MQSARGARAGCAAAVLRAAVDDASQWAEFREEHARTHRPLWAEFNEWVQEEGAPPLPELDFVHTSDRLNLYVYPQEIDYAAARPLDATWHRLDSSVRQTETAFEVPDELGTRRNGSALIYLSLGSLGSADVELMQRLVEVLAQTPHRYIVSRGPRHADYGWHRTCGARSSCRRHRSFPWSTW